MEVNFVTNLCDNAIKTGKSICLTAVGRSMWPFITEGMRAVISPLKSSLPSKGSLLLIKRANGLMVHRYWGMTGSGGAPLVLTKGDTNLVFDPPVPISMVLGKVSLLRKKNGDGRDPNRGWLYLFGRIICSSDNVARVWARLCRLMMRITNLRNYR